MNPVEFDRRRILSAHPSLRVSALTISLFFLCCQTTLGQQDTRRRPPQLYELLPPPSQEEQIIERPCGSPSNGAIKIEPGINTADIQVKQALGTINFWAMHHLKFVGQPTGCWSRPEALLVWQKTFGPSTTGVFGAADLQKFAELRAKYMNATSASTDAASQTRAGSELVASTPIRPSGDTATASPVNGQPPAGSPSAQLASATARVFGLPLGEPLAIGACPIQNKLVRKCSQSGFCSTYPQRTENRTATCISQEDGLLHFAPQEQPSWVAGGVRLRVVDGRLVELKFQASNEIIARDSISKRFGEPTDRREWTRTFNPTAHCNNWGDCTISPGRSTTHYITNWEGEGLWVSLSGSDVTINTLADLRREYEQSQRTQQQRPAGRSF